MPAQSIIEDVSDYPHLMELADLILVSKKLHFEIASVDQAGVNRTLKLQRMWPHASHLSFVDKQHREPLWINHDGRSSRDEVVRLLLRLLNDAKVRKIDERSLKTQTLKCPLKPKALKQQVLAALNEGVRDTARSDVGCA